MALEFNTTNGVISNGEGGIKVSPGSTEIVTIENGLLIPDGVKTKPAIRFTDDDNTGIYSPVDDTVSITGHGEDVAQFEGTVSAVNHTKTKSGATGAGPIISAEGTDTNIDLNINPKGTGSVVLDGLKYPTADGTVNQVIETDGSGNLSFVDVASGGGAVNETYPPGTWNKETCSTSGTGDLILTGAPVGFLKFFDTFNPGVELNYHVIDGQDWELGSGTLIDNSVKEYWRLRMTTNGGDGFDEVRELELYENIGSPDVAHYDNGIVSAASQFSAAFGASNAFNGVYSGNSWLAYHSSNSWLEIQFNISRSILEYGVRIASVSRAPKDFTLEYSDDGTNWTVADTQSITDWTANTLRKFPVSIPATGNKFIQRGMISSSTESVLSLSGSSTVSTTISDLTKMVSKLDTLNGVSIVNVVNGHTLQYDGTNWTNSYSPIKIIDSNPAVSTITGNGSIGIGTGSYGNNTNGVAIGKSAQIGTGNAGIAIGNLSKAYGDAVCIGNAATSLNPTGFGVAIGALAKCNHFNNTIIGSGISSSANYQMKIGVTYGSNDAVLVLENRGNCKLEGSKAQWVMPSYTVTTVPVGTIGGMIFITDGTNANSPAFYDGTNWKWTVDNTTVS